MSAYVFDEVDSPASAQLRCVLALDEASSLPGRRTELDLTAELVRHPELGDVELQLADCGQERLAHADLGAEQDLDDPLRRHLGQAAAKLLVACDVGVACDRESLRGEAGQCRKRDALAAVQGV